MPRAQRLEASLERIFWSTASICEGEGAENPELAAFDSMMEDAEPIAQEVGTTLEEVRRILREKMGRQS